MTCFEAWDSSKNGQIQYCIAKSLTNSMDTVLGSNLDLIRIKLKITIKKPSENIVLSNKYKSVYNLNFDIKHN